MTAPRGEPWLVAAFGLGVLSLLLLSGEKLLGDPDTYWHIVTGQRILATWTLPTTDTLSHTFAGSPWIAKEWLAQLLLALAYDAAGWRGVVLLTAATFALAFALLLAVLLRRLRVTAALALALLALPLVASGALARPHAFLFPLLVVWTAALSDAVERGRAPSWWLLAVMALWANLHASFPIALVIAGAFGLEALLAARPADRARSALRWAAFGLAALAVTGLTPYGYDVLLLSVDFFGRNDAVQFIAEWQPLDPGLAEALCILGLLAPFALLVVAGGGVLRLLPVLPCAVLMVQYGRFTGLFGIVAAISVAGPLGRQVPALAPLPIGRWRAAPAGVALLGALALALALLLRPSPLPNVTPAAALDAALAAGARGPVFNAHDYGGYLIWRGIPTFIDGRNDQLFHRGFATALYGAERGADDAAFLALLDRHGITWALVPVGSAAAEKLARAAGWRRVHADDVAAAFLRD